ncbi:hypothetical protein J2X02_003627 [Pseudoxanthomonas japonensis]|nr:hypothetical protein [Pseudoxanthomonas japonensis]
MPKWDGGHGRGGKPAGQGVSPSPTGRGVGVRGNGVCVIGLPLLSPHPRWLFGSMALREASPIRFRWRRLPRGALLFFACAKKSKQKKHTPAVRPPQAAGSQSRREFSCRASCPVRKRRTSLCAAPAGFYPPRLPDLRGPKSHTWDIRGCRFAFACLRIPMRHGEWSGYNPKGAVMDDGVSEWHMDVPYGNSRTARGPCAQRRACRLGCVSLILSLHKQRKNALRGERHHA